MSLKKLGRYDLVRVLGKGAMGLVYEGRDPNLDRRVAIKTIKVENLSDEAAAEYEVRFRTEARSAARLQHPNIVSVYDSDRDGDIAFLVMEFVEGDDLKHHLDKGEVYTLEQTLGIMGDLLSALSYAHQQKIVHRDIKPANLLVQASGRIKLADFGVARIQDSGDATRTQGSIVGTLKYMSPEQLEGRPIDARADLFAAGVVLYQLLTGARPFDGDTDFAVIQKIVNHTPAAATFFNAKLPPAIDAAVAKSLAKSRDMRYSTAQDFAVALQAACKEATDTTIAPNATAPGRGSNSTWTATMMAGESLVATESGVRTNSVTRSGTNSGTGASLVTQEVELVYWKDIKDSTDIEDLQGFLEKFPSGIYADLARRRLKNLGVATPSAPLLAGLPAGIDTDKTMQLPKRESIAAEATVVEPGPKAEPEIEPGQETEPEPQTATQSAPTGSPAGTSPKKGIWVLAGVAALAVSGVAFKLLSGPGTPAEPALPLATSITPAPPLAASAAVAPLAATPAALAASAARPAASAPGIAARAASRAAAAIASRKSALENDKDITSNASETTRQTLKPAPAAAGATATAPAAAGSPRAACEDRMLLGFQICMNEQCAKPVFNQHPICIERRAMDERRRESERNR